AGDRGEWAGFVEREDALGDQLDVEQAADTETRMVGRHAADEAHRRAPGDTDADVVHHLARADLEAPDAPDVRPARGRRDRVEREGPQRDRPHVSDLVSG